MLPICNFYLTSLTLPHSWPSCRQWSAAQAEVSEPGLPPPPPRGAPSPRRSRGAPPPPPFPEVPCLVGRNVRGGGEAGVCAGEAEGSEAGAGGGGGAGGRSGEYGRGAGGSLPWGVGKGGCLTRAGREQHRAG